MRSGMTTTRDTRLFLHLSNRLENLAEQLAINLAEQDGDPLSLHTVVVSSAETARWLSMQLATSRGLAMGMRYPFLRSVIDELAVTMLGTEHACSARYNRDSLAWWLYDRLPDFMTHDDFGLVRNYLHEGSASRRFELARRLASLFDQYQVYRPQMLRDWDAGKDSGDWQSVLWRALRHDLRGEMSFVDLHAKVLGLDDSRIKLMALPPRISIFGLNTLPPAFLDVLHKAACHTRVDFYLLSPTHQYWSDLVTEKQRLRSPGPAREQEGNPVANSLGKLGRDLLDQLLGREAQQLSERFEVTAGDSLLERLQLDLLELTDRTRTQPREIIGGQDCSIEVHSCHSPMREVEVLHDRLLAFFQDNPSLRSRDVLVMAPDIELYAPYIRAVFGAPENDALKIPYSLADQSSRTRHELVDAFLRILEVGLSRFEASRVVALLENETLRAYFGMDATAIDRIRKWAAETGVVRGLDANHRTDLGLGQSADFSWARSEATLVFGYAMNGNGPRLYDDIQPFEDLEGDALQTLECWLNAMDVLRDIAQQLRRPRTRPQWSECLGRLAVRLFGTNARLAAQLRVLQGVLTELSHTDPMQREEKVPAEVIVESIEHRLRDTTMAGGFLDGRVTFCSLKPMRAIPAKVICLLGLDEGLFPRQGQRLAFDLMAVEPQRGDRSPRDDDRYLFLEALLSTRGHLYISHVGQSQRDPVSAPPASVVTELVDYLEAGYDLDPAARGQLHIRHRLQAFSHHYFAPGPLQSFSPENAAAARQLTSSTSYTPTLFSTPLAEPEREWKTITPTRLVEFFAHPSRFLAERRLEIRLKRESPALNDFEPVQLDALTKYQLQQSLVDAALKGKERPLFEAARARGKLPYGAFGALAEQEIKQTVTEFLRVVRQETGNSLSKSVQVNWAKTPWRVEGSIHGLHAGKLCKFRCANLKAKDLVAAWIDHLLVNTVIPGTNTCVIGRDGKAERFLPPPSMNATEEYLQQLLELYWRGLQKPLYFFPESSLAYADVLLRAKPGSRTTALRAAERAWLGSEFVRYPGEGEEPWNALLFVDQLPLNEDFENTALAVFRPLYSQLGGAPK